jgi:hypothetical protein
VGAGVLLVAAGCSSVQRLRIVTEPPGAAVTVGKESIGRSPLTYWYDAGVTPRFVVTAGHRGYFTESVEVTPVHAAYVTGELALVLHENPAWEETTAETAANTWFTVRVRDGVKQDEAWVAIVSAVTAAYGSLAQIDPKSGYLGSAVREGTWDVGDTKGLYHVRTQCFGSFKTLTPLVYTFMIKAEYRWDQSRDWQPYDRIFTKDAELVAELRKTLSAE